MFSKLFKFGIHIPVRKYDHFLSVKSSSYMYVYIYTQRVEHHLPCPSGSGSDMRQVHYTATHNSSHTSPLTKGKTCDLKGDEEKSAWEKMNMFHDHKCESKPWYLPLGSLHNSLQMNVNLPSSSLFSGVGASGGSR